MGRWEYCELAWKDDKVKVRAFSARGNREEEYAVGDRASLFARLGILGWELVSVVESPKGTHDHWCYFRRRIPWWWVGKIPLHLQGK